MDISNLTVGRTRICRVCFLENDESIDMSKDTDESKELVKRLYQCFQITLQSDDCLPCVICKQCQGELNTAYLFRHKCLTIHERFKEYCGSLSKPKIVTLYDLDTVGEFIEDNQSVINGELFHVPSNKKDEGINYVCDFCKKVLKSKKSLLKHIVSMHEKRRHVGKISGCGSTRQYHCTSCSYSTPHSQTLVNHMRRHNGERPFNCECGKYFTQASSLAAHRKTHSNTTYFTCSQCGKQFKHAFSLKTHLKVHSNGIYSCNICSRVLKSKQSLSSHINRHNKVYNFNCEDCGDTFVTSAELCNHRMKHSTDKNIKCHICEYATYSKKNLLVHLKRHQGDKAYKCSLCEKAFLTDGKLQRHKRVHTREKPFSCQTCTQRFAYSSSLNNHMLTVHGVKYKWGEAKLKESRKKLTMKTERDNEAVVH